MFNYYVAIRLSVLSNLAMLHYISPNRPQAAEEIPTQRSSNQEEPHLCHNLELILWAKQTNMSRDWTKSQAIVNPHIDWTSKQPGGWGLVSTHLCLNSASSTDAKKFRLHTDYSGTLCTESAAPQPFCMALSQSVHWHMSFYIATLSFSLSIFSWI